MIVIITLILTAVINYYILIILQLDTLRVSDLKDYLKSVGVKASGRKQELIDQVKDHLGL